MRIFTVLLLLFVVVFGGTTQEKSEFSVVAFYNGKNDPAHISFVKEANRLFSEMAKMHQFFYDTTNDWNNMNSEFLSKYDVVFFLDTRPDSLPQREAFQKYMENGGAWLGFHFCAFALTPSDFPQNWDWYHNTFLGSGQYKSNTWRPTSAVLKVEDRNHSIMKNIPEKFTASPNEWYRWENDLRENPDIKILASVHPESFPLGTGPKPHEIWHEGYYPVVWTNIKYKMVYVNMGHNDIDYEGGTNNELSFTFNNEIQNRLILNMIFWLVNNKVQ